MDLIGSKIVMLVLIVLKTSKNETEHFFSMLLAIIVVKQNDRFVVLFFHKCGLFDESYLFPLDFIHNTFEVRFDLFFFITKNEQIVLSFVF